MVYTLQLVAREGREIKFPFVVWQNIYRSREKAYHDFYLFEELYNLNPATFVDSSTKSSTGVMNMAGSKAYVSLVLNSTEIF